MKILLLLLALSVSAFGQASVLTIQEADGVPKKAGITKIIVTNGTLSISGTTATIETGGGGEGAFAFRINGAWRCFSTATQ